MKKNFLFILISAAALLVSCVRPASSASSSAEEEEGEKSGAYQLQFSEDFNAGKNYIDDLGISIVIVMDVSGSMSEVPKTGGPQKFIQAAGSLATVADYLERLASSQPDLKINAAVLRFSTTVSTVFPLTVLDAQSIQNLKAVCVSEQFLPRGNTAIGLALERGAEILAQSGTIFNSLILVTDGENTSGTDPEKVIEAIYENRNNRSTSEYPVRTSTQLLSIIGFDINSPKFERLHQLGARVMAAGNQSELEKNLKALLEADITKLEGL